MPTPEHEITRLAKRIGAEIDRDVEKMHDKLAREIFDDADQDEVGERRYLEAIGQRLQAEPEFPQQLYTAVGPAEFNRTLEKLMGLTAADSRALRKTMEQQLLLSGEIE